jgi:hypothetical protein
MEHPQDVAASMVTEHFLRILEIGVGGCRLSLTRLSASAAASGAVVVAAVAVVAEAVAFAEAYYNIINNLQLTLGRQPRTHYDCYSAWPFGPYHSSPYSYHFADSLASETDLASYLVDVFVEAFVAVVLAWNGNFAN